ncbi:protein-disulfide reductase DsbD [Idiomarina piscisalsi]|uniref:Thiol:disulfide interchange protein DsbD n=1 Tax=Idiomarina piscisalsi TaxID=1096243 RepID=A0ABN5AME0_9GAMM|nr:protein-disulfide reductase DsbD [Idiomarina piscisalsi]ASG64946.1 protein-disulfide reductase DsbD [Idiomarina piscisalsi]
MRKSLFNVVIALFLIAALPAHAAQSPFASNSQEFLPVDQAFDFSSDVDGKTVTVSWLIAPDYYLYQHRFSVVPENALAETLRFPKAESHHDEFFGESFIYREYVELTFELSEDYSGEKVTIQYQGCADAGLCYPPTKKTITLDANTDSNASNVQKTTSESALFGIGEQSLVVTLLLFFVFGIGLAFTPCVFPMYPILSGVVLGNRRRTWRNTLWLSFIYVQGMAITYSLLGLVVALAGMQYQAYFQHPAVLIVLAVLFTAFAFSMFGAFTLQLPVSWQSRLQQFSGQQKGGSPLGVFIIGAISGLVASPCTTAPLSGALLFIAQSGDIINGAAILYALSLGMGVPLILFGLSGGKLLPKAGAWMTVVKQLFGWLLLAVTLFLVERLLPTHISMWLWIFYFVIAAGALIAAISRMTSVKSTVVSLVILSSLATVGVYWQVNKAQLEQQSHGLFKQVTTLEDIQREVAESDTWVMLDLYADWCVACKEFEQYTFSDASVQKHFENMQLIQADVTANNQQDIDILNYYNVLGLPTILFFSPSGEEQNAYRVTGFKDAKEFKTHLEKMLNE